MCRFIESIKVDFGLAHLAKLHQQRVNSTFNFFGKPAALDLRKVLRSLVFPGEGLFKLRISYDLERNFAAEFIPYAPKIFQNFTLVDGDGVDYSFKYEDRSALENLKAGASGEIIIVKNGQITDSSFSNLVFIRKGKSFTPKTFLLNGVQRQYLLNKNAVREAEINIENLRDYSHFQIINAMNGLYDSEHYPIEKIINLA